MALLKNHSLFWDTLYIVSDEGPRINISKLLKIDTCQVSGIAHVSVQKNKRYFKKFW